MNVLEVKGLTKAFGGVKAVTDVSFNLREGELLALIGPNGAGKTTCFNMLNGHLRPNAGSVRLHGQELIGLKPRQIWRMGVGRTFQITAAFSSMTVLENVQMALISHHRQTGNVFSRAAHMHTAEAGALTAMTGLTDQNDRACLELAYGDLKRLELAVAMAHKPKLLLMDEPTAGMAPSERIALMALTSEITARENISVVFTEHDMDVVFAHAHRIIVMNRGGLIAEGSGAEIRADPKVQEVYLGGGAVFGGAGGAENVHA